MKSISYEIHKEIPVLAECDTLVIGGGPGGTGAAVMSAECGAETILAEQHGCMGGTAFFGEITPMMRNHYAATGKGKDSFAMDRPVYPRFMEKMRSYLPEGTFSFTENPEPWDGVNMTVSKDLLSLAMEDVCLEAGVRLLYHFTLVGTVRDGNRIEYAVFHTRSGFAAIRAKNYIDATGDGELAALSGCRFEFGDREHGLCQPMTLCFKLSHVDKSRVDVSLMQKLYREAQEAGEMECKRDSVLMIHYDWEKDVFHFNTTRVSGKSAIDALEHSEAELEGRRQMRQFIRWIRAKVPGFEKARIYSMAPEIGVRESRRILGRAYLTEEDFLGRSKFPDAIARCNYPIDIHQVIGGGTRMVSMGIADYYEIPYGCIVPADCGNLLMAGRPISVSHEIHASCRVMPPACSIGQAAGAASALALQRECDPGLLDGREVRSLLKEHGAWL